MSRGDGDAGPQVDQVDRVVGEVVVVALVAPLEVGEVERGALVVLVLRVAPVDIEARPEIGANVPQPSICEKRSRACRSMAGGRDEARVEAEAGAARRVGPGRGVVGQRDVGERLVREVEAHRRARARAACGGGPSGARSTTRTPR